MGVDSHHMMYQLAKSAVANSTETQAMHSLLRALSVLSGRGHILYNKDDKDWYLALHELAGSDLSKLKFPDGTPCG